MHLGSETLLYQIGEISAQWHQVHRKSKLDRAAIVSLHLTVKAIARPDVLYSQRNVSVTAAVIMNHPLHDVT
jgi:hypothetical protein